LSGFNLQVEVVEKRLQTLLNLAHGAKKEEILYRGRDLLNHIEFIVSSLALLYDATVSLEPIAEAIAIRWIQSRAHDIDTAKTRYTRADAIKQDRSIFLGDGEKASVAKL
jgi:hypothetical protein